MRVLIGQGEELAALYAVPRMPWLRVNFVATLDGAATGEDGRTGTINNEIDQEVFALLRRQSDAVIVGAGTAREEGYEQIGKPLVVVSRSGRVPTQLLDASRGEVLLATCAASPGLATARSQLGDDAVIVAGGHRVDLLGVRQRLVDRGWLRLLCEGGPHLLRDLLDQGAADEIDLTVVPRAIGGSHTRITDGPPVDVPLTLHTLVEDSGTLLMRWLVDAQVSPADR